jgi:transposase
LVKISDHDLRQIDAESLHALRQRDLDALEDLALRLANDLKEAKERLNQTPDNSSRPPGSRDPWSRIKEDAPRAPSGVPEGNTDSTEQEKTTNTAKPKKGSSGTRSPGKQKGSQGYARAQQLPITATVPHYPTHCFRCGAPLSPDKAVCYTGYESINAEFGDSDSPGLRITNTKHLFFESICACGHHNRCAPAKKPPQGAQWGKVAISEWRLIDSGLAALMLILHFRMRLSVRYCREFMIELFGVSLCDGAISQSLHESARAVAPAAEQVLQQVRQSNLAYSDETPHYQAGEFLWLWVLANAHTVFFAIGRRTKELFLGIIGLEFAGWLMSDGYLAYRYHKLRLRCWAHLIRKARSLAESYTPHVQGYGKTLLEIFDRLIEAIHLARAGPPTDLRPLLAEELEKLRQLCEKMARSANEKAAKLGGEILNDWAAIFRVLEHPHMPLTNNFSERLLRHWVILRRITQGTRSPVGSLALTTVASVVETCRLRNASPLRYLQSVIEAARKGIEIPPLPPGPEAVFA